MQLSLFNYLHFGGGIALQIILVFLVLRRGLARRFPVFLSYLILLVLYELIYLSSIFIIGYKSHAVFMIYWTSQEILLVARGAVVAELVATNRFGFMTMDRAATGWNMTAWDVHATTLTTCTLGERKARCAAIENPWTRR